MPTKTNFYLNNTLVNPPMNHKELAIELNYDREKFEGTQKVSINEWEFVRENSDTINQWVNSGTAGGVGIFEGIPLRIEIDRNGTIEKPFDGYVDLTDGTFSCNRTTVNAKERQQIDWLNDVADSFTFEYLYKEAKKISKNDFIFQPYIISAIPDYKESAIALITAYILRQEIESAIEKVQELTASLTNPFEATAIIRAIFYIIYLTALILALLKLIKDVINFLIQPVKYHACMSVKTQLEKGAAQLGMTFSSPILNSPEFKDMVILPEKLYNPVNKTDKRILGFTVPDPALQEGFFKGTFGDLLRAMKTMFKAKVLISNGVIYLLRVDQGVTPAVYQLPDLYQPFNSYNANEMYSNYLVSFLTDLSEANTIQQYQGTSYQVILRPVVIGNKDLVLTKNLREERIPMALAKMKTDLTVPEEIIKGVLTVFNALLGVAVAVVNALISIANLIIKILNKIIKALKVVGIKVNWVIKPIPKLKTPNLTALIDNRLGMLLLEKDYFNEPKIFLMTQGTQPKFNKISANNSTYISAKYLYNNFHFVDSFVPSATKPNANQFIIKEFTKVPFCFDDFQKVKLNNSIFVGSTPAEIESLKWDVYNQHADMRVRISQLYTTNLKEVTNEPTGI